MTDVAAGFILWGNLIAKHYADMTITENLLNKG
jgi:hypothetical protein